MYTLIPIRLAIDSTLSYNPVMHNEKTKENWEPGERARLARTAGISQQHLSYILTCQRRAGPDLARRLELACHSFGIPLGRDDFVWPEQSESPLITRPA